LAALLCFFTALPMGRTCVGGFSSLYLLPVVGLVRGVLAALPIIPLMPVLPPLISSALAVTLHFVVQGFLHADGFIDFAEAAVASRFGVDAYRVVKDRYRGSYAVAIFPTFLINLYAATYIAISEKIVAVLVVGEVWGLAILPLVAIAAPPPPEGLGKRFRDGVRAIDVVISILAAAGIASVFGARIAVASTLTALATAVLSIALIRRVLGFVNGDALGFAAELTYAATIIACAAWLA